MDQANDFYREEVYGEGLLEQYVDLLGIQDSDHRADMKDHIVMGAMGYERTKISFVQSREPKSWYVDNLKKTKNLAEKLQEQLYKNLGGEGLVVSALLMEMGEMMKEGEYSKFAEAPLSAMMGWDGPKFSLRWESYPQLLEFYITACDRILEDDRLLTPSNRSSALLRWLNPIHYTWKQYSDIPLTQGEYFKEVGGYNSEAIHILLKIMEPLDAGVTATAIAEQLKKMNKTAG